MEIETKQLTDGRTVAVRPGIVGGVKIGNQLVMDGEIRTVNGRYVGAPLKDEWEKQITLYFTDSNIGVRGDEAQTIYHLEEGA